MRKGDLRGCKKMDGLHPGPKRRLAGENRKTPINQQNTAMISEPSSLKADTGSKVIIIGDEVTTLYSDEVERTGLMSEIEAKRLSRERKEKEAFLKRKAEHLVMSKA